MMIKTVLAVIALATAATVSQAHADDTAASNNSTMIAASAPQQQCIIESGFDFVGEDLSNVPGAVAEDCCDKCSTTTGCKAFSWTNANGGTCYLKRTRGKVVVNPAVRSALVTPNKRAAGELKTNADIVGNDIGNRKNMAKPEDCTDACRKSLGCRAFTWTSENGGTCYFKSGRGQSVYKEDAVSADVYPAVSFDASRFNVKEANVDFGGGDLSNKGKIASADGCFQPCRDTPFCGGFTWTNFNGGTCWFKYGRGTVAVKQGAVSGLIEPMAWDGERLYDMDFVGNDLGNSREQTSDHCAYKCLNFVDGCKAATFTNYNGGTCWYKSAGGDRVTQNGAISYVMP